MSAIDSRLEQSLARVNSAWAALRLDSKQARLQELQQLMSQPNFWSDRKQAEKLSQEASSLEQQITTWSELRNKLQDIVTLSSDQSQGMQSGLDQELAAIEDNLERHQDELLFTGEYDDRPAILTIYSGAGGVDAQDWAQMLERMYLRLADQQKWPVEILNRTVGQEAGIKNTTIKISGLRAYGYLKTEGGVHRLVRLSPYDADQLRHTSFAMVEVLPELDELADVIIDDQDLKIDVYRSSGHGGQSVNTTDSAVRLTHLPTGIVVTCQNERSQMQNKEQAKKYLLGKLQKYYQTEKEEERQALRGELTEAAWGNQIRSYVLHPYKMVKDHRTKFETKDPDAVLGGDLMPFMIERLKQEAGLLKI
ncbi:MAG: peptide chain release factor 2 [Candidatus Komeilibacteria bacterium]